MARARVPAWSVKKRSHKIAAVDGGDKGRFVERAKCFGVVPVVKMAAEFLHALDGSKRAAGESRKLGGGQESKLACDLPGIEQQTDIRWRDARRFRSSLLPSHCREPGNCGAPRRIRGSSARCATRATYRNSRSLISMGRWIARRAIEPNGKGLASAHNKRMGAAQRIAQCCAANNQITRTQAQRPTSGVRAR